MRHRRASNSASPLIGIPYRISNHIKSNPVSECRLPYFPRNLLPPILLKLWRVRVHESKSFNVMVVGLYSIHTADCPVASAGP